jgi:hypothetical protein
MASAHAHVAFSSDVDVDPFPAASGTCDGPFANSKKNRCLSNVEITELLYAYISVWNSELKRDQHAHYVAVDVVTWHQAMTHYFNPRNYFLRQSVLGKLLFDCLAVSHEKPEIFVTILHVASDIARYCLVLVDVTFRQIVVFDTHSVDPHAVNNDFTDICSDLRKEMINYHVKYISLSQYNMPHSDSVLGLFGLLPLIFQNNAHDLPIDLGQVVSFTLRNTRNMLSHAMYTASGKPRAHSSVCKRIKIMLAETQFN